MVIDFALPVDHDLEEGYREYIAKSKTSVMDYAFHMAITCFDSKVRRLHGARKYCGDIQMRLAAQLATKSPPSRRSNTAVHI